jgi:hypothetical protein
VWALKTTETLRGNESLRVADELRWGEVRGGLGAAAAGPTRLGTSTAARAREQEAARDREGEEEACGAGTGEALVRQAAFGAFLRQKETARGVGRRRDSSEQRRERGGSLTHTRAGRGHLSLSSLFFFFFAG